MRTLPERLADAMKASGYEVEVSDSRLEPIILKLEYLVGRGRFGRLLSDLFACNHKSNLHALLFEAVFAWHFEIKGKHLRYEVIQQSTGGTTVDFLHAPFQEMQIYYELRLLQQQDAITALFEDQLKQSNYFGTLLDGDDEQREVIRLQQVLLAKVQDRNGQPVKYFTAEPPNYNVLVVDVSQPLLGMLDKHDCILACYGDEAVPPLCRRDVFGLFQIACPDAPPRLQAMSRKFDRMRETIHGILFMRRPSKSNPIDFELQFDFIPNRALLSTETCEAIIAVTADVFPLWKGKSERA